MKLTRISAQQFGIFTNLNLHEFSPGLNVIFGRNQQSKSTFRNLLRGLIYGFDSVHPWENPVDSRSNGLIEVVEDRHWYRISRGVYNRLGKNNYRNSGWEPGQAVVHRFTKKIRTTSEYEQDFNQHFEESQHYLDELCRSVSAQSYDAFFDVGFKDTNQNIKKITHQLNHVLHAGRNDSNWPFDIDYWQWKKEANDRQEQLSSVTAQIENKKNEKLAIQSELNNFRSLGGQLDDLNSDIASVENETGRLGDRRDELINIGDQCDQQIESLRIRISEIESFSQKNTSPPTINDSVSGLYRRLDKIDDQLKRWRSIQNDVQVQRIRLRDKMVTWSQSTVDLNDYPFGDAQQKITELEHKISQVKKLAGHWIEQFPTDVSTTDSPKKVKSLCDQMNADVYALCNELGTLQAYIQQRSAVVELKQLRRCYAELNENIKRLVEQRKKTIIELRDLDPAGVSAIERAELKFCQCAEHEGYLTARQRYVDPSIMDSSPVSIDTDASREKQQLEGLLRERQELLDEYNLVDRKLVDARAKLEYLIDERNQLVARNDEHDLLVQLDRLEGKISSLIERKRELQAAVESDRRWYDYRPDSVLGNASRWLSRLSSGQWDRIRIDHMKQQPIVSSEHRSEFEFVEFDFADRDVITLSLLIAAVEAFAEKGVRIPLVLDDVLQNLDQKQVKTTLGVLEDFCRKNHQVIVLTDDQRTSRILSQHNIAIQELPDTSIVPRTFDHPEDNWRIPKAESFARKYVDAMTLSHEDSMHNGDHRSREWIANSIKAADPISENVGIESIGLIGFDDARTLQRDGIETIRNLLDWRPEDKKVGAWNSIGKSKIKSWQDQAGLVFSIPGLRVIDARILTGCYIYSAFELDKLETREISTRISKFLKSDAGKHYAIIAGDFDNWRIDAWKRSMQRTRSRWQRHSVVRNRANQETYDRKTTAKIRENDTGLNIQSVRLHRESFEENNDVQIKFYLELDDTVEQAPSIGPKTAERLEKAGVISVSDLLEKDAEEIVSKLDYKRIKADHVRDWQKQTELVCSIPNLRGHDAQVLVACGITNAEQLASMDAKTVLGLVEPFSKTKEGIKMLRTNKRPDLAEVTDWINWAKHKRNVLAA